MTDARKITEALGGKWRGDYGITFCPAHNNTRTPALSLSNGDDGKLLAHCFAGCSFEEVISVLNEKGIVTQDLEGLAPDFQVSTKQMNSGSPSGTSDRARAIWRGAQPINGTPAEGYLQARGIECDNSIQNLRYSPDCYHPSGGSLPAMIARIEGSQGFAVHCTYINPETSEKADLELQKIMFGPAKGGAVRLLEGKDGLIVAEGIETCLSIQSGISPPPFSAWAALSASNMRSLILPPNPSKLIIAPDGDTAGRQAAHELAVRAHALGWQVLVTNTPDGMDWNEVLQEGKSWS